MINWTFHFQGYPSTLMSGHSNVTFAGRTPKTEKVCSKFATVKIPHPYYINFRAFEAL
jgi:hypothetical protein